MKTRNSVLSLFICCISIFISSCKETEDEQVQSTNNITSIGFEGSYNVSYAQTGSTIDVKINNQSVPLDSAGCASIYETFFGVGTAKISKGTNDSLIYTTLADTLKGIVRNDSLIFKPKLKLNQTMNISPYVCTIDTVVIYCKAVIKNNMLNLNYKITDGKGHYKPSPTMPASIAVSLNMSLNGKGTKQ